MVNITTERIQKLHREDEKIGGKENRLRANMLVIG